MREGGRGGASEQVIEGERGGAGPDAEWRGATSTERRKGAGAAVRRLHNRSERTGGGREGGGREGMETGRKGEGGEKEGGRRRRGREREERREAWEGGRGGGGGAKRE